MVCELCVVDHQPRTTLSPAKARAGTRPPRPPPRPSTRSSWSSTPSLTSSSTAVILRHSPRTSGLALARVLKQGIRRARSEICRRSSPRFCAARCAGSPPRRVGGVDRSIVAASRAISRDAAKAEGENVSNGREPHKALLKRRRTARAAATRGAPISCPLAAPMRPRTAARRCVVSPASLPARRRT